MRGARQRDEAISLAPFLWEIAAARFARLAMTAFRLTETRRASAPSECNGGWHGLTKM
jgi:hypothetical protein